MIPDEPPPVSVHGRDEATTLTQAVLNQPPVPRTPSLHVLPRHRHPSARSRGEERAAYVRTCVRTSLRMNHNQPKKRRRVRYEWDQKQKLTVSAAPLPAVTALELSNGPHAPHCAPLAAPASL